jgi:hypothetical protein
LDPINAQTETEPQIVLPDDLQQLTNEMLQRRADVRAALQPDHDNEVYHLAGTTEDKSCRGCGFAGLEFAILLRKTDVARFGRNMRASCR